MKETASVAGSIRVSVESVLTTQTLPLPTAIALGTACRRLPGDRSSPDRAARTAEPLSGSTMPCRLPTARALALWPTAIVATSRLGSGRTPLEGGCCTLRVSVGFVLGRAGAPPFWLNRKAPTAAATAMSKACGCEDERCPVVDDHLAQTESLPRRSQQAQRRSRSAPGATSTIAFASTESIASGSSGRRSVARGGCSCTCAQRTASSEFRS